jgi:hypothetical protein
MTLWSNELLSIPSNSNKSHCRRQQSALENATDNKVVNNRLPSFNAAMSDVQMHQAISRLLAFVFHFSVVILSYPLIIFSKLSNQKGTPRVPLMTA